MGSYRQASQSAYRRRKALGSSLENGRASGPATSMNQEYVDAVRLLLAIAPAVFRSPHFALKGGTALNLFLHDMPRLSVDIDVVFTDHTLGREDALRAIAADLKAAKSAISALGLALARPPRK